MARSQRIGEGVMVETYASMAWVSASIPVWAVRWGMVSASSGSTMATSGVMLKSASGYLTPF